MWVRQSTFDLLVLLMVSANALAGPAMVTVEVLGWLAAATGLFGTSTVVWIALSLAANRLCMNRALSPVSRLQLLFVILAALGCLLPSAQVAWSVGALYFLARTVAQRRQGLRISTGNLIALAVCIRVPATWVLTTLLAEPLLAVDAVLSGLLASLVAPIQSIDGNIIVNASGHKLFVMTGCSSLNNLSLALLFWFAMTRGLLPDGVRPPRWHLPVLASLVIGMNVFRLSAMSLTPAAYGWLHDGFGADVVLGLTALTVAALTASSLRSAHDASTRA